MKAYARRYPGAGLRGGRNSAGVTSRPCGRAFAAVLLASLVFLTAGPVAAQSLFDRPSSSGLSGGSSEVDARVIADTTAIEASRPFRLGVHFDIQPDWHIYWRYAGEVGIPTSIEWSLPEGFTVGDLQWPNPHAIEDPSTGLSSYGWDGELVLFATVTPPEDLDASAEYVFEAKSSWLACKIQCVPGSSEDSLTLSAGPASPSEDAGLIERFAGQVPVAADAAGVPLTAEFDPAEARIVPGESLNQRLVLEAEEPWLLRLRSPEPISQYYPEAVASFFPDTTRDLKTSHPALAPVGEAAPTGDGIAAYDSLALDWELDAYEDAPAGPVTLRPALTLPLVNGETGETRTFFVALERTVDIAPGPTVADAAAAPEGKPESEAAAKPEESGSGFAFTVRREGAERSLALVLIFALLGGMLLNVMPCVLPVLSLKVMGFVNQARESPRRVLTAGLVFALGVYVSFLALALVVVALKVAGAQVGWGFQLQEPRFVVLISAVIFAFGLSLFGVFSVELPGMAATTLQGAASKGGHGGDFMNGVLATVLATPCTAPLLGPALGFAFSQPPVMIVAFFLVIATGLALPYVLLAARPGWLRFVPKPGPWMERFKQFMGVLLMGTVVWLLSVLGSQAGAEAIVAAAWFLLAVGVACWAIGWGFELSGTPSKRTISIVAALALVGFGYFLFPERQLSALGADGGTPPPVEVTSGEKAGDREAEGIDWKPFSVEAVNALVAENKTVFVDFTADWCLTCKVNERTALSNDRVIDAFREYEVEALVADYTRRQPEITKILNDFGRAGVPMYIIFPAGRPEDYILLPEVLTPSLVIEKLEEASRPAAVADAGNR